MSKKYDISLQEIADFLCQYESEMPRDFSEQPKGFSLSQIQEAEKRIGITFPEAYKSYLLSYGQNSINNIFNRINALEETLCSYDCIEEVIEDYPSFGQLPKEQWHTLAENYVLIWCENQGVWNAGYLKKDVAEGVLDPPVYISTNDDFITFEKGWENTDAFLKEMLFFAAWEKGFAEYRENDSIWEYMEKEGLDKQKLCQKGIHSCIDTEKDRLYLFLQYDFETMLLVSDEEYDDEE